MADPIRIVFMGTPDFALPTLTSIIDNSAFKVEAVFTQPDRPKGRGKKLSPSPVKELALEHRLTVFQPEKAREGKSVDIIKEIAPGYLVVVAYGHILPESILQIPSIAPVNLHASLLPKWRGAAPIHRSFLNGDKVTGVCTMIMVKAMDAGDVLLCREIELGAKDTIGKVHDRLAGIGAELMVKTLIDYRDQKIEPKHQDEGKATYASKLTAKDFIIDWSRPAEEVSRKIRGLSPLPGAMTTFNAKILKPLFAKTVADGGEPGQVVKVSKEGITVACGAGSVLITRLKPEGKSAMPAYAYTLGSQMEAGSTLE